MKIHSVKLRNVRHIRELSLELPGPLVVIGGPNGAGKSTLQESILAAMFFSDKRLRDSFVSQFDPDSSPTVTLALSRGGAASTIVLTRCLLDDKGEWQEGGAVLKKKKQALDKVQEILPITADAAALLLWGRQDDMPAVVEGFPSDGHTLLTAATIQGTGPDPKAIVKQLEKDSDDARKGERGGQVVGALVGAKKRLDALVVEMEEATRADEELSKRRQQLHEAKNRRDQLRTEAHAIHARLGKLDQLDKLLGPALEQMAIRDQMVARQTEWEGLEAEIAAARKHLTDLQRESESLLAQYRVARDEELALRIDEISKRIQLGEELESACAELNKDLKSTPRPDPADVRTHQTLQSRIKETQAKIEATGVRYELSAGDRPRSLRLAEDGQDARDITLAAGQSHQGIVGRLTVEADGLRFSAAGKEDISGLKQAIQQATEEAEALFEKFAVKNEAAFQKSAKEKEQLQRALEQKKTEMRGQLGTATAAGLKSELERLQSARRDNNMSLQDREACAGKRLPPAGDIHHWCAQKQGEIQEAREGLAALEEKRPNEAEKDVHKKTLEAIRTKAREAAAAFTDADETHREPSRALQSDFRRGLERERHDQTKLASALLEFEKKVAELQGQLKQARPHRAIDEIQADLEEAKEAHNREQTLQEARDLLAKRIAEKMDALAAHVPVELGNKVTEHLARLTGGAARQVTLDQQLAVAHVGANGAGQTWRPGQLSYGERHQAALAVKIAVARALAETSGPVFVILDDSLVTFDPHRRAATEDFLLDLVGDDKLQVILLTCHTDWAADWQQRRPRQVNYLELAQHARYYNEKLAVGSR